MKLEDIPGKTAELARERFPIAKLNAESMLTKKEVPVHRMSWAYYVGGLALFFFLVQIATGLMLHYFTLFPDDISTGATFVHDAFAAAVVLVTAGHIWMAWADPEARPGLRTGSVSRRWAERAATRAMGE